jgi:signal transduction histidine kinase
MVDVDLETERAQDTDLPPELTGQLLSIAREALSNIARHSKATQGSVHVETDEGAVKLIISDNGVGFDARKPRAAGHQGLVNMRARASSVGGRLDVQSEPGFGTRIIVDVPRREAPTGVTDRGEQ